MQEGNTALQCLGFLVCERSLSILVAMAECSRGLKVPSCLGLARENVISMHGCNRHHAPSRHLRVTLSASVLGSCQLDWDDAAAEPLPA